MKYTNKYVIHHLSLFVAADGGDVDDGRFVLNSDPVIFMTYYFESMPQ